MQKQKASDKSGSHVRMSPMEMRDFDFSQANAHDASSIFEKWKWVRHGSIHLDDGFTLIASRGGEIVGFISVQWRTLPAPLNGADEGFIDIIEVQESVRREGIGRRLIQMAQMRCRERKVYQLRAWSSEDKKEAIPMWHALGFGLCPATEYPKGQPVRGYFVAKPICSTQTEAVA